MSIATQFNFSRTLAIPGPTGPTGPAAAFGQYTSFENVADQTSITVLQDMCPYFFCSPAGATGCKVLADTSPPSMQHVTLKNLSPTNTTYPSVFNGNGAQVEQPLAPGTFSSSATLNQSGQLQAWDYVAGTGWVLG